jgi:hypothetical protein
MPAQAATDSQAAPATAEYIAQPATRYLPDGDVGWMPAIDIRVGHESGNIGMKPSEVVAPVSVAAPGS